MGGRERGLLDGRDHGEGTTGWGGPREGTHLRGAGVGGGEGGGGGDGGGG
jgi:hypothetical protein